MWELTYIKTGVVAYHNYVHGSYMVAENPKNN